MSYLLEKCTDPDTGARNAENVINKSLLPVISNACLTALAKGEEITEILVELNDGTFVAKVK
jgi:type VI secretion system protein VasG